MKESENLNKGLRELELLFLLPENVSLFNQVKSLTRNHTPTEGAELKEGFSFDDALNVATLEILQQCVFDPCEKVHMFYNQPFKVVQWIKWHLAKYDLSLRGIILSLILEVINDKRRFDIKNGKLDYLRSELSSINVEELPHLSSNDSQVSWIKHFTGNDSLNVEALLTASFAVRGYLMTEEDKIGDFIRENRSEIIRQLKEEHSVPGKGDEVSELQSHQKVPIFKKEATSQIHELLKSFFEISEQDTLKALIQGEREPDRFLCFLDNGNRLADAFRKLKDNEFIVGCTKKELELWIASHFTYKHKSAIKHFTPDYLEKLISRNGQPCKKPLFKIDNGKILNE
jgi:hypothetical protein